MPLKFTKAEHQKAKAAINHTVSHKGQVIAESNETEDVNKPSNLQPVMPDQQCEVGVAMGYTHNAGNYTSARVDVSLKVPCAHPEVNDVYDFARAWVEERLEHLVAALQE